MHWDRLLEGLAKITEASRNEWAVLGLMIAVVLVLALSLFPRTTNVWIRLFVFALALAVPVAGAAYLLAYSSLVMKLDNTTWKCEPRDPDIPPPGLCDPNPKQTPRIWVNLMLQNERGDPPVQGNVAGARTITYGSLRGTITDDLNTILWDNHTKWTREQMSSKR